MKLFNSDIFASLAPISKRVPPSSSVLLVFEPRSRSCLPNPFSLPCSYHFLGGRSTHPTLRLRVHKWRAFPAPPLLLPFSDGTLFRPSEYFASICFVVVFPHSIYPAEDGSICLSFTLEIDVWALLFPLSFSFRAVQARGQSPVFSSSNPLLDLMSPPCRCLLLFPFHSGLLEGPSSAHLRFGISSFPLIVCADIEFVMIPPLTFLSFFH